MSDRWVLARGELRGSKVYARVGGVWYESAHAFRNGVFPVGIRHHLYRPGTDEDFWVSGSEIEAMERVVSSVRHQGFPFLLNSFWSSGDPSLSGVRITGAVSAATPGVFALLNYEGPLAEAVARLPLSNRRWDEQLVTDQVLVMTPVGDLQAYSEEVETLRPVEAS